MIHGIAVNEMIKRYLITGVQEHASQHYREQNKEHMTRTRVHERTEFHARNNKTENIS